MTDLSKLPDSDFYELWKIGIPKTQAYYRFVPEKIQTRYSRLKRLVNGQHSKSLKEALLSFAEDPSKPTHAKISPYREELDNLEEKLKRNILLALQRELLIPIGYEVPRHIGDKPVLVPKDIWSRNLNWNNNSFKIGSLEIEDVRFVHKNTLDRYLETNHANIEERDVMPQGRPSKSGTILEAYEYLVAHEVINFTKPQKDAIYKIQMYIKNAYPELYEDKRGLGTEAIRGHIAKDFRARALKIKTQ